MQKIREAGCGRAGGTQEPNESPRNTLLREVKEETDLSISRTTYLGKHALQMPHGIVHIATFRANLNSKRPDITIDPFEHDRYEWFSTSDLLSVDNLIWGLPTTLQDFGILEVFGDDPTLTNGSTALALEIAYRSKLG